MTQKQQIQLFEEKKVRTVWDDEQEKWYFSIVDVCNVLTESKDYLTARKYWNKLKQRLKEEGNETVTNCHQLKLRAEDGKMRSTDVADTEQMKCKHCLKMSDEVKIKAGFHTESGLFSRFALVMSHRLHFYVTQITQICLPCGKRLTHE